MTPDKRARTAPCKFTSRKAYATKMPLRMDLDRALLILIRV
jgi:hypothetical protein